MAYKPLDRSKLSQTFGAFERQQQSLPKCPVVRARNRLTGYMPSQDAVCPVLPHERREMIAKQYRQVQRVYDDYAKPAVEVYTNVRTVYEAGRQIYNRVAPPTHQLPYLPPLRHTPYLDSTFDY